MSTCTWLNLAVGMSIFSTVVLGCLVTLALLQAAHSLHQATTSVANPGQTKWAATRSCTCWKMARLCVAGTSGLMAPVEVSHHSWTPCVATCSTCKPVLLVSSSWDHCRRHHRRWRGPGAPIPVCRGGQRPGGHLYASHVGRPGQGELLRGPGKTVSHHLVRSSHVAQVRGELSHVGQVSALSS